MDNITKQEESIWDKVSYHISDKKNLLNKFGISQNLYKYNLWRDHFDKKLDISLFQGSFEDLKNSIQNQRYEQDKYIQTNPLQQLYNSIQIKFDNNYFNKGKLIFFKDFGFLSKKQKKKLGLSGILGVNNLLDSGDKLNVYAWAGINDPVNNELNLKMNYFSLNQPPLKNINNIQLKGRYQQLDNEKQEYLYQIKFSSLDEIEQWIFSAGAKLYVNEFRGIDRQSIIFYLNRKSLLKKQYGFDWTSTSRLKQTFAFDYTRKSFFFKSIQFYNFQRLFKYDLGNNNFIYFNFMNNFQKGYIINVKQMIQNEQFQVNYQPGYINNQYDPENSGLNHLIQNTTKLEMIKLIPNFDPFMQLYSSLQIKRFNLHDITHFKSFVQNSCKAVVSAGGTVDLGFVKIGLLYNILDLIPFIFKREQKQQFQQFQVFFSD
ncbi:hypothetical protein ABPG72_007009 [Tetrahymena utriculariae]